MPDWSVLKGLAPRDPRTMTQDERIAAFKKIMEPQTDPTQMEFNSKEGPIKTEVTLPSHPYPFQNPITMTKDLDTSVKNIRGYAPGAGTAKTNIISDKPPITALSDLIPERYKDKVLTGKADLEDHTNITGLASPYGNKGGVSSNNEVYVTKRQPPWLFDETVAHELSHRNTPGTFDYGGGMGTKDNPSSYYLQNLYGLMSRKDAEDRYNKSKR